MGDQARNWGLGGGSSRPSWRRFSALVSFPRPMPATVQLTPFLYAATLRVFFILLTTYVHASRAQGKYRALGSGE